MPLTEILGPHENSEVVVIMDSGYDCKKLKETIISRNWDFTISVKSDRSIYKSDKNFIRISTFFQDGWRPWKTFRIKTDGSKKNDAIRMLQNNERET
jgi:hypothetical protein